MEPIRKLLIANRGEIACRVLLTAQRLGIATVAVYSDADADARHVRLADEAVRLGPAPASESYLDSQLVLAAARHTGAEAIHPGYGFLSENAVFAEACRDAGIRFVGPPPAAIRAMGGKSAAKALMVAAGVPVVPGYHGVDQSLALLQREADGIGYPVLIKASAGGGGKGMRVVRAAAEFAAALTGCQRESLASFGDDTVLLEKYLQQPRHIEIQVFADTHGACLALHERDCSVQRRHQKVVEEAPAPGMTPERRRAMGEAAVNAARAVGYVGAGTVEFIVDRDGQFYFMEMNTRLQVEDPVTEMITGLDLVEWQLRVAAGERLPLTQAEVPLLGHAIEVRLYAENPFNGFLPSTGRLRHLRFPRQTPAVRVDTGVDEGDAITPYYDPMIAKLIVHGSDRAQALERMRQALGACELTGVDNNLAFLQRLLHCASFVEARLDTGLIEREQATLLAPPVVRRETLRFAAQAEWLTQNGAPVLPVHAGSDAHSPWAAADAWRVSGRQPRVFQFRHADTLECVTLPYPPDALPRGVKVLREGTLRQVFEAEGMTTLQCIDPRVEALVRAAEHSTPAGHLGLRAPMPGKMIAWLVPPGTLVVAGTPLLVMEAMKMEHTLTAPKDGHVAGFHYAVGEQVPEGAELVDFAATENQPDGVSTTRK